MPVLVTNQAESTSVGTITSGSNVEITVQTTDGALFPAIDSVIDYFYVRLGTDETNEVVKIIGRTDDVLTAEYVSDEYAVNTPIKLTVCAELFDDYQSYFFRSAPIVVGGDSPDFATLNDFFAALQDIPIKIGRTIDVTLRGVTDWNLYTPDFATPQQINFSGEIAGITLSSIQSSSGSAGNYSVVLNVSSVTGLLVDQVVGVLPDNISGGTNPQYLYGAHKITNVDVGNSRITVNTKHQGVPSGAVTGDITVFKTVLNSIVIRGNPFASLTNIAVDALGNYGLNVSVAAEVSSIAIINGDPGVYAVANRILVLNNCYISDCLTGISNLGHLEFNGGIIADCDVAIFQENGHSFISTQIHNCGEGVQITNNSTCLIDSATINNTTGVAIHASRAAYVKATNMTLSGNGTDYSPALNTQGNKFGYIDDGT